MYVRVTGVTSVTLRHHMICQERKFLFTVNVYSILKYKNESTKMHDFILNIDNKELLIEVSKAISQYSKLPINIKQIRCFSDTSSFR